MSTPIPPVRVNQKHQKKLQKEQQRQNGGVSTSAVVQPIQVQQVQPQRHEESIEVSQSGGVRQSPSAQMARSSVSNPHKDHSSLYNQRGQSIRPQCVPKPTLVSSVAELVHDVIPQASTPQTTVEHIEWVSIQKCAAGSDWKRVIDVVVIGLARGYQIWALMESGDCEEVLSMRQGPLKVGRLLASDPEPSFGIHKDKYASSRPLFAIVDGSRHVPEPQFCTLSFLSLTTAKFVREIAFPDPICAFEASTKVLVVCFTNRIVVCDSMSLREQRCIFNCQINDALTTPFSISDVFLAYADTNLVQVDQSCGGMASGEEIVPGSASSYTSGVINVAKSLSKTVSAFGETVVSSLSSSPHSKTLVSSIAHPGIVTVVDANKLPSDSDSECERSEAVMAHFVAHSEPIGYLSFAPGGQMLLTSGQSSTYFHIFLLYPHPGSPALGSVRHIYTLYRGTTPAKAMKDSNAFLVVKLSGQSSTYFHIFLLYPHPGSPALGSVRHIYTLYRGTTPAKVLDSAFSMDGRWLALATNHGTTHLFAVCPYGGAVTMRTHGGRIVNRESRFHRSAGLTDSESAAMGKPVDVRGHQFGAPQVYKEHPCLVRPCVARSVGNPRIGPYSNPIAMNAIAKIRLPSSTAGCLQELGTGKNFWSLKFFFVVAFRSIFREFMQKFKKENGMESERGRKKREHPCLVRPCVARSVGNPRIGPYSNPIAMNAIAKIRQRFLSADNLSAWASDLTSVVLSSGKRGSGTTSRSTEQHRLSVSFASNAVSSIEQPSLLVIGDDGVLTEYSLEVGPALAQHPPPASSSNPPIGPHPRLTSETPVQCNLRANASWQLQRCKSSPDVRAPLAESNPLLAWLTASSQIEESKPSEESEKNEKWITQIEVVTYSEPHRRLWTGPQFTFKTYLSSGHSSADLVPPGESGARSFPGMSGLKSVPVMIEAAGSLRSFDVDEPTQIVCGSWSSDAEYKSCDEHYDMLREKIEEAMQDLTVEGKYSSANEKCEEGSSDASQSSLPSRTHSSRGSRDRDRDSLSLQFANIDM
ncbi:Breast carcinoma-amplified sequence 3 [Toxocara canis]|uniref:Breast carcinoma-amplified sequence 3 n=1 Tax=Toxocara canis TaxID=6265 RepID=A0A0B2VKP1_TOXCA|nr:Breast carcinoma-amplified sequence 3 [Toxocara canis]